MRMKTYGCRNTRREVCPRGHAAYHGILQFEQLEARLVLDSTVVINELMYNLAGDDQGREWIELYNQLSVDMDVSRWRLEGGVNYTFPDRTVVPGRGYLLVAADPSSIGNAAGTTQVVGPFSGRLNNAGEELRLYNNDERLMNVVDYGDRGDWPVAADGSGASLAKLRQSTPSNIANHWTFSSQIGGTPGAANFFEPGSIVETPLLSLGATARVHVPIDGNLGSSWKSATFDDSTWIEGSTGVGYHRTTTYDEFIGLDLSDPPNGAGTDLLRGINQTIYVRVPFEVPADLSQFDSISMNVRYEDGFVAYLNGVEIASANAPGRDGLAGTLSWFSGAIQSRSSRVSTSPEPFDITAFRELFVEGENVLAFHGLNRGISDTDFLLSPEIVAGTIVRESAQSFAINEVTAADDTGFFVELTNHADQPMNLHGLVLASTGVNGGEYVFPGGSIEAGGLVVVSEEQLGFRPDDGEKLFLYSPGKESVLDGRAVTGRLRGRSVEHQGQWLYPDTATPGTANQFAFEDSVVINEIMYHAPTTPPVRARLPEFTTTVLSPLETTWRHTKDFNFGGTELPISLDSDWATVTHAVDGDSWREGLAPIGNISERRAPVPLNTELVSPRQVPNFITTYYFETEIGLSQEQLDSFDEFALRHLIDDGAVFYVNGQEVDRHNITSGEITSETLASIDIRTIERLQTDAIASDLLVALPETNRISVEVHQSRTSSSDVYFGVELVGRNLTKPGTPFVPAVESPEEWIELYNRGSETVDLTGWSIEDAVEMDFPEGTVIAPGEFLVVANDMAALSAKYPDLNIAGEFSRVLSNHDERIRLLDANENPADDVHYYESGNWPLYADGGGSSLELRDPGADNSNAAAWAASDESAKSEWRTFTFRELSQEDVVNSSAQYNEFLFGLLDNGEFLIDDISVVQDPDGQAISLLQNGTFEDDTIGGQADRWRIIGTHQGTVVPDPDDPNNNVLHVTVTGPHQFVHDYGSTTFVNDTDIQDGDVYEFSFRAKWLAGNSQLNTRLYFNRAGHTTPIGIPTNNGTPGAANSTLETNLGPTYGGFGHHPIVPSPSEEVTVSARAEDPDGVAQMTLWWQVDSQWNSTPMTAGAPGTYSATIPPQAAGDMVQFYVEGVDTLGATSTYPAAGADSRALYQVEDGAESRKPNNIIDTFRMIYLPEERDQLFPPGAPGNCACYMGNNSQPFTLIHNNTAFYDAGIRLIGSRFVRPNSGYKIHLGADNAFYGVHDSIRFDIDRQSELVIKQMINAASNTKSSAYDDLSYLVSPRSGHNRVILLQLTRFEAIFLDEQFENGSEGTKFELDDVTRPTSPQGGVEGPKRGTAVNSPDIGINAATVAQQGQNPEFYRGHLLIKSQRVRDDYEAIADFARAIHLTGDELDKATQEIMDVDLWMRQYAIRAFIGDWDTYGFRRPKNLRIYIRPEDGKVVPLFWDSDQANFTEPIYNVTEPVSRLDEIRDLPHNLRVFWGHMLDLINRSFNPDYAERWINHYSELAGGTVSAGVGWNNFLNVLSRRTDAALAQMQDPSTRNGGIAMVPFEITTNGGSDFQVDSSTVTLSGTGWIDIRQIRLQGTDSPLDVRWPESDRWEITLPLGMGENEITLATFDYQGNPLSTDSITVTSTVDNPVADALRITEINYNPHDPLDDELSADPDLNNDDFEFIEVQNVSAEPINLLNARFTNGIDYTFPLTVLDGGQRGVLVKDAAAFSLRYGDQANVLGEFADGNLNNNGEVVTLVDGLGQLVFDIEYSDGDLWPESADGLGATLQLADPAGTASERAGKWYSWRASTPIGGTPGSEAQEALGVVINEVLSNTDDPNVSDSIELFNTTSAMVDIGGWYLSDSGDNRLKYRIAAGTRIPPGGYLVFDESHFNPTPEDQSPNHFALSGSGGDDVWLTGTDDRGNLLLADEVHFGAAASGQSLGRVPNGSGHLAPNSRVTLGSQNAAPTVGSVIISEVNYDPGEPSSAALAEEPAITRDDLEYLEIFNSESSSVDLLDWRIRGGVDLDFTAGPRVSSGQSILVVSFNPDSPDNASRVAAFQAHYALGNNVTLVGGYQGQLSNSGERIQLQRPGETVDGETPWLYEDEVLYDNLAPWPTAAAGAGLSLTRVSQTSFGNSAGSWQAANPTPGTAEFGNIVIPGDSNQDGVFNQLDIVQILQAGRYLTGQPATFAQGDWNGDGVFDQADIVSVLQADTYNPQAAAQAGTKSDLNHDAHDELFARLGDV